MLRLRSPQVVRVRIAPSPTGIPHIGNTRTALFNFLFAKHHKGIFILRIEDTDQARILLGAKEAILEILEWLGLIPDETYVQSERLGIYKKAAQDLLGRGFSKKDDRAVRFIVPKGQTIEWDDAIGNKKITFKTDDIEDFIILKSDGFPTYHLANVVDDHEMKITHVIRGDEWISSTPKHILLYRAFGWEYPIFAHLPVILGPDKTKLSKRHGAESVLEYRDRGYLKEAILNYMALLGWSGRASRGARLQGEAEDKRGRYEEIMSLGEMIKLFDLKDVNLASPTFDIKKLEWMNGVYIRQLSLTELNSKVKSQKSKVQSKIQNLDAKTFDKLIELAQTRMKTLRDFYELVGSFITPQKIKLTEKEKDIAKKLREKFVTIKQWNNKTILGSIKNVLEQENIKMSAIYKIMTGRERGLPIANMLEILGKEETIHRLKSKK